MRNALVRSHSQDISLTLNEAKINQWLVVLVIDDYTEIHSRRRPLENRVLSASTMCTIIIRVFINIKAILPVHISNLHDPIGIVLAHVLGRWMPTSRLERCPDSPLVKRKGDKSSCDNYRGISLLSVAGKILCKVILNRLNTHLLDETLPESQCGFRKNRGTVDMIFCARQIQEKCIEQNKDLYILFVDLTKAFDTVPRSGLWNILPRIGIPPKMVKIIRSFHDDMKARLVNGNDEDEFPVTNGVKQGCVLAPTLFSFLLSMMLLSAFKDIELGVQISYRTDGGIFNLRRLNAKTKVTKALVRDLLYADDFGIVAHSEDDLQRLAESLSAATKRFGLTISMKKTVVLFQPAKGSTANAPRLRLTEIS